MQEVVTYDMLDVILTPTQKRRWVAWRAGARIAEIADAEGVTQGAVHESLAAARRRVAKAIRRQHEEE